MAELRYFRVAVEGDTTDGRKITRQDILDCAETFNPALYGVRINLEHFRAIIPGGSFDMLGDVTAVKAEEVALPVGNVTQKVMGLFAAITPLPAFVEINKKKQKIFSSIEIGQNCRGTGKAYLVGMAATDSPASFGTEALEFAARTPGFYSNRKLSADNLLCQAYEIPQEVFSADQTEEPNADPTGVFGSLKGLIDRLTGTTATPPAPVAPQPIAVEPAVPAQADPSLAAFGIILGQMASAIETSSKENRLQINKLTTDLAALTTQINETPQSNFTRRLPATGGHDGANYADVF